MFLESEAEKQKQAEPSEEQGYLTAHFGGGVANPIDLVIDKNRYNAPRTIKLQFNGEYSDFQELP